MLLTLPLIINTSYLLIFSTSSSPLWPPDALPGSLHTHPEHMPCNTGALVATNQSPTNFHIPYLLWTRKNAIILSSHSPAGWHASFPTSFSHPSEYSLNRSERTIKFLMHPDGWTVPLSSIWWPPPNKMSNFLSSLVKPKQPYYTKLGIWSSYTLIMTLRSMQMMLNLASARSNITPMSWEPSPTSSVTFYISNAVSLLAPISAQYAEKWFGTSQKYSVPTFLMTTPSAQSTILT